MKNILLKIEQLDLSGRLLRRKDSNYGRLALLLIDNVVELILYQYAKARIAARYGSDPEFSQDEVKKVLDRGFDNRLWYFQKMNLLDLDDISFCREAHELRNEAYHSGVLKEDIIYYVSWHYHEVACRLFRKFPQGGMTVNFKQRIKSNLKQHLKPSDFFELHFISSKGYGSIATSLSRLKPSNRKSLGFVLSKSLAKKVREINSCLHYLKRGEANGTSLPEVISAVQKWKDGPSIVVKSSTIKSWLKRIKELRFEKKSGLVLQKYRRIIEDISEFEECVSEYTKAFDRFIDMQIDMAREEG